MRSQDGTLLAFLLLLTSSIWLQDAGAQESRAGHTDRRIRSVPYSSEQVVKLHGWVGFHIDLEFEKGESFKTLGGGDLEGLTYGAYENHLILKPRAPAVRTNLTVITDRRTYILDYMATSGTPDPFADDLVYSLRFIYPPPTGFSSSERVSEKLARGEEERTRNFDYWFCGASSMKPVAASDDGVHTRIRFPQSAEIPAMFVRMDDGTETLLNYSIDHGDVIIHRTARRILLRRGKTVGCIVNQGYGGAGERLPSGTVSPEVERTTKGVRP